MYDLVQTSLFAPFTIINTMTQMMGKKILKLGFTVFVGFLFLQSYNDWFSIVNCILLVTTYSIAFLLPKQYTFNSKPWILSVIFLFIALSSYQVKISVNRNDSDHFLFVLFYVGFMLVYVYYFFIFLKSIRKKENGYLV
jgi:hypothetical protein